MRVTLYKDISMRCCIPKYISFSVEFHFQIPLFFLSCNKDALGLRFAKRWKDGWAHVSLWQIHSLIYSQQIFTKSLF